MCRVGGWCISSFVIERSHAAGIEQVDDTIWVGVRSTKVSETETQQGID